MAGSWPGSHCACPAVFPAFPPSKVVSLLSCKLIENCNFVCSCGADSIWTLKLVKSKIQVIIKFFKYLTNLFFPVELIGSFFLTNYLRFFHPQLAHCEEELNESKDLNAFLQEEIDEIKMQVTLFYLP